MDTKHTAVDRTALIRDRLALEAELNAKPTFINRVGLLPLLAGAATALATIALVSLAH